MKTINNLEPKLRFPEFTDEWKVKELGEISERITEKVSDRKLATLSITAGIGFVTQAEKFSKDISGNQYKNYIYLKKGQFSYNKGNSKKFPQGCIYELKNFEEAAVPNAFISFRFLSGFVTSFFQKYFEKNYHGIQLKKFITSGARSDGLLNVSPTDFFSISFPYPNQEEQQKIADCLTSFDELIALEEKKLTALNKYKKGLTQKLFPQGKSLIPELRFSEFQQSEMEFKNGNELFEIQNEKVQNNTLNLPVLAISQQHGAIPREKIDYTVIVSNESLKNYKIVQQGDFIISLRSFQGGIEYSAYNGICSPAYIILRSKKHIFCFYYKFYFKTKNYIKKLTQHLEGIRDGKMISYEQFSEVKLPFPKYEEQQKIADFLSSVDELIENQEKKLEQLQQYKKGLLQGLFPNINGAKSV